MTPGLAFLRRRARFMTRRRAQAGLVLLAFPAFMVAYGAFLDPYPARAFPCLGSCSGLPPFVSLAHFFGTNSYGQDIFSEVAHGAAADLYIGFGATLAAIVIGVAVGSLAGYGGGVRGTLGLGFVQFFFLMPTFAIVVWFYRSFGSTSLGSVPFQATFLMVLIGVFAWPPIAMVTRNEVMKAREMEYVAGARALGAGDWRIVFRHIIPNVLTPLIGIIGVLFAANITAEALFAYLGLVDPSTDVVSWGFLIWEGSQFLASEWWSSFFPGLMLVFTTVGVVLLGDAVSDELNPKLMVQRGG